MICFKDQFTNFDYYAVVYKRISLFLTCILKCLGIKDHVIWKLLSNGLTATKYVYKNKKMKQLKGDWVLYILSTFHYAWNFSKSWGEKKQSES